MRKINFSILALMTTIFLVGCATSLVASLKKHNQPYTPPNNPNVGLVYFYRESEFAGSFRGIYIDVDGKRVGALNSGTYFVYEANPGKIEISVENWLGKDNIRTINVEAGKKYYVKGGVKMGFWDAVPYINVIAPEEGDGAIENLTYATIN